MMRDGSLRDDQDTPLERQNEGELERPYDHTHDHEPGHAHEHHGPGDHNNAHQHHAHQHHTTNGVLGFLGLVFHHHHDVPVDHASETSSEGIRILQISLVVLAVTALLQLIIALRSGSVGLLADTIHNFSDAFTALPLWIAFIVSRWPANRRYTYGYGRTEDLAGVVIIGIILVSAILSLVETYHKLVQPAPLDHVWWVAGAALVGFVGNESVAVLRSRTGRRIGSAALQADGDHARIDGMTSLAVLVGAVGVWLGAPIADPIVGLVIGVAILFVAKDAAGSIWNRLMDAVDPELCGRLDQVARSTPGIRDIHEVRLRWSGHRLLGELRAVVAPNLTVAEGHAITEELRHRAFHALPHLATLSVHLEPAPTEGHDQPELTA